MEPDMLIPGAAAVIIVCALYLTRVISSFYGKIQLAQSLEKYKGYAVAAFKFVEENIPDDYGKSSDSPRMARAAHKIDLFLKEFANVVRVVEGKEPSKALKDRAMVWATQLASSAEKKDDA